MTFKISYKVSNHRSDNSIKKSQNLRPNPLSMSQW
jgi:hypothetical protein